MGAKEILHLGNMFVNCVNYLKRVKTSDYKELLVYDFFFFSGLNISSVFKVASVLRHIAPYAKQLVKKTTFCSVLLS